MIEVTHTTCVALCSAYADADVARAELIKDGMSEALPYRGVWTLPFDTGDAYVFSVSSDALITEAGWVKVDA